MFLGLRAVLAYLALFAIALQQTAKVDDTCNSTQFYNYIKFTCESCPANTTKSASTFCNCSVGYYHS